MTAILSPLTSPFLEIDGKIFCSASAELEPLLSVCACAFVAESPSRVVAGCVFHLIFGRRPN